VTQVVGELPIERLMIDKMTSPTETLQLNVLVVGCGIAGLTTAVACSQKGFKVRVLESSPEFAHVGNCWQVKILQEMLTLDRLERVS